MSEKVKISELAKALELTALTPEIDTEKIEVGEYDINRPALQLAGFFDYFTSNRVQVVGNVECAYLDSLDPVTRREKVDVLFSKKIPCLVYCRDHKPSAEATELAYKHGVPLFTTKTPTSEMTEKIIHYLKKRMAPSIVIHGVLIDIFGVGVMITGESGIGKSEAALELIKRGHRLVADDAVEIHKVDDDTLIGCAPYVTKDFLEVRGIGVIDVRTLFGLESIKNEQQIECVINVEDWDKEKEFDRLGTEGVYEEYLGTMVPKYTLPLRPGRNLAVIVEAVAVNFRQRTLGYNATDELYRRVQENMNR